MKGDVEISVVIKFEFEDYDEYVRKHGEINHEKFKSNGSIVLMKDCDPWHDYTMNQDDLMEFYDYFEGILTSIRFRRL